MSFMNQIESAYATFRIAGDDIEPATIQAVLGVKPTVAYRKGESYRPGPKQPLVKGRTGVFLISTRGMHFDRLDSHLWHLVLTLFPQWSGSTELLIKRVYEIKKLIKDQKAARTVVSCFWYGEKDSTPVIDPVLLAFFEIMSFEVDLDFVIDEPVPQDVVA
jgi:hypothetical protein